MSPPQTRQAACFVSEPPRPFQTQPAQELRPEAAVGRGPGSRQARGRADRQQENTRELTQPGTGVSSEDHGHPLSCPLTVPPPTSKAWAMGLIPVVIWGKQ